MLSMLSTVLQAMMSILGGQSGVGGTQLASAGAPRPAGLSPQGNAGTSTTPAPTATASAARPPAAVGAAGGAAGGAGGGGY
jgi:hypothetical protein